MLKTICDRCGGEIVINNIGEEHKNKIIFFSHAEKILKREGDDFGVYLCDSCLKDLKKFLENK